MAIFIVSAGVYVPTDGLWRLERVLCGDSFQSLLKGSHSKGLNIQMGDCQNYGPFLDPLN